jgi:hypothetical protein
MVVFGIAILGYHLFLTLKVIYNVGFEGAEG